MSERKVEKLRSERIEEGKQGSWSEKGKQRVRGARKEKSKRFEREKEKENREGKGSLRGIRER